MAKAAGAAKTIAAELSGLKVSETLVTWLSEVGERILAKYEQLNHLVQNGRNEESDYEALMAAIDPDMDMCDQKYELAKSNIQTRMRQLKKEQESAAPQVAATGADKNTWADGT